MYNKKTSLLLAVVLMFTMNTSFVNANEQTVPPQVNIPEAPSYIELPVFPQATEAPVTPEPQPTPEQSEPSEPTVTKPIETPETVQRQEAEKVLDSINESLDQLLNDNSSVLTEENTLKLNELLQNTTQGFINADPVKVQEVARKTVEKTMVLINTMDSMASETIRETLAGVIASAVKSAGTMQVKNTAGLPVIVSKADILEKALSAKKINEELTLMSKSLLNKKTNTNIRLTVELDQNNALEMELPEMDDVYDVADFIEIETKVGAVTFNKQTFGEGQIPSKITIEEVSKVTLPKEFENVRVVNFKIHSGSNSISQFKKPIVVTMPYSDSELTDSNFLTAFFLDENGVSTPVPGYFKNGVFTFKTNHFSQYYIGMNKVEFLDVTEGWSLSYIQNMAAKGIIKGKGNGMFDPSADVTRAEFISLISRVLNYGDSTTILPFEDVSKDDWYFDSVKMLYEAGILESDAQLNPNEAINREEMGVLLGKALIEMGYNTGSKDVMNRFTDVSNLTEENATFVATAVQNKLLEGFNGFFSPEDNMTREQAATVIFKLLIK